MKQSGSIDRDWAWASYEPSDDSPWNVRAAAHLFRRAGFAASRPELEVAIKEPPAAVIDRLLDVGSEPTPFRHEIDDLERSAAASGNVHRLSAVWAYRMLNTPSPLLEKMTLFWHGHFATSASKVQDVHLMLAQNHLLREHALGSFSRLLLEISRDPAMLVYLDSATNRKAHPNENYAREIMELFCLGEGNYTEADIRELARCFTGWEVKRNQFRFNRYQHDTGTKSVLGSTGKFGGEQAIEIVLGHESAPRFLAAKLVRYLVMDEPGPSDDFVEPLAVLLRESGLQIRPVVRRILSSNLFFSSHSRGRKVRSPVELGVGFLRSLEGSGDAFELAQAMEGLGQGLFYPPSVKGWGGGRAWINSATLVGRANMIRSLLHSNKARFGKRTLGEYLVSQGVTSAGTLLNWFEETLLAVPLPAAVKERITRLYNDAPRSADQRLKDSLHALCTLPEFQLS